LHHVLNSIFWFGLGECTQVKYMIGDALHSVCVAPSVAAQWHVGGLVSGVDGSSIKEIVAQTVRGDLNRFFAGDPGAGVFMTGFFPIMMFGLPAAALAMYLAAPKNRRYQVGGLLFSVALTAFLTGVTEPLEFMFMFLAPGLYAIHAVLTGISLVVTNSLGILHGFGFSAGLFDFVINWGLATKPWLLVVVGLVFSVIYFVTFYGVIVKFDLKTPGRETDVDDQENGSVAAVAGGSLQTLAGQYVTALGGAANLTNIDACITRLRLQVQHAEAIDERELKRLGASGVVKLSPTNIQVVVGTQAEIIAGAMKDSLLPH